jgi:hypothetical protein
MRGRRALYGLVVSCLLISGCGTTQKASHATASHPKTHASVKPDVTQIPTDPSTGAKLTDCGKGIYATSCQFAIAVIAKYTARATQFKVADSAGTEYVVLCGAYSSGTIGCGVGTGIYGGFGGDIVVFPTSQIVKSPTTTTTPQLPKEASTPPAAECSALYAQWQADGEQEDQAIQEYGQIGCGQSAPNPSDDWCKTVTADNGQLQAVCDYPPHTPGAFAPSN